MKEKLIVNPIVGTERLTLNAIRVLQVLTQRLDRAAGYIDYDLIAREVGLSRNGVKYCIAALIRAELVEKKDGKLRVLKKIVL